MIKSILVTGGNTILTESIKTIETKLKYNFIFLNNLMCDLSDYNEVYKLLTYLEPHKIIHIDKYTGMSQYNILANENVIKAAHTSDVHDLITCIEYNYSEPLLCEIYSENEQVLELYCKLYRESFNRNYIYIHDQSLIKQLELILEFIDS